MTSINKEYTLKDSDALNLAIFHGYKETVVDETLLDSNGNIPEIPLVDKKGKPVYQKIHVLDDNDQLIPTFENYLDESGNPVQLTAPLDVYIDNPVTAFDFLSQKLDDFVIELFIAPEKVEAKKLQKEAEIAKKIEAEEVIKVKKNIIKGIIATTIV